MIGSWLKKNPAKRDKVLIATKCGMDMPNVGQGLSAAHIKRSVDEFAEAAQHRPHRPLPVAPRRSNTPQEETLSTYGGLIKAGKLRYIGASNFEAPRLAEAAKIAKEKGLPRYESLQPHYNLMERGLFEGALENECLKEGIGVIPYYSLASGFLSGKYKSEADAADKARSAGVKKYLNDKGFGVLKALDAAARKHNANSDPGGARLADAAQGDHRADRQRHQPRPAQGPGRRARDQARSGVGRRHRQGERAGLTSGARTSTRSLAHPEAD